MKSCQLWGLATSAHYKKISMEETKRNQKKPVSLDWLRENLQETMVFTIKYRVFLWIFPSSNSMTVASSQWSYEEGHFPLQMWHFLKKNPSKIRNQSAAAFCRGPQHGLAGCAEDISDSEHGETGHGQLILWDEDPIFVTQFLWPNFYDYSTSIFRKSTLVAKIQRYIRIFLADKLPSPNP